MRQLRSNHERKAMKKKHKSTQLQQVAQRLARESTLAALREGRKNRATTFADRKKKENKRACRGRVVLNGKETR